MKTELARFGPMLLGGMGFYGDPFSAKAGWDSENEIGKTWQRFTDWLAANPGDPRFTEKSVLYELHVYSPETPVKGVFEVFVGGAVSTHELDEALIAKWIPAGEYLKVTLTGTEITGDWGMLLDAEMLPQMGLERRGAHLIQAYDARFKGTGSVSESEMDAYIPVQRVRR